MNRKGSRMGCLDATSSSSRPSSLQEPSSSPYPFLPPYPILLFGRPLVAGLRPFPGENRLPTTTSTEAEYRGASVHESRDDRRFGKIFLKSTADHSLEFGDQNVVPR